MVKKVIGKANDFQFVLTRKDNGDMWEARIPVQKTGQYVVDLYAEDEAGNMAYAAMAILTVNADHLRVELVEDKKSISSNEDWQEKVVATDHIKEVLVPALKKGGRKMQVEFILGEDKYVKIRVYDPVGAHFAIFGAQYELIRYGRPIEKGNAIISGEDEHEISARISPPEKGGYVLEFTYQVADTTRKARVDIEVM